MGQNPTKAANNIYCQKRKEAAKFNDKLNSREGASELIGVSPSALADYELGITKVVPVDAVIKLAEVYNAPELLSYYCHNECPLGDLCYQEPKLKSLDRAVVQFLASMQLGKGAGAELLSIVADGQISPSEYQRLEQSMVLLENISHCISELQLRIKKGVPISGI